MILFKQFHVLSSLTAINTPRLHAGFVMCKLVKHLLVLGTIFKILFRFPMQTIMLLRPEDSFVYPLWSYGSSYRALFGSEERMSLYCRQAHQEEWHLPCNVVQLLHSTTDHFINNCQHRYLFKWSWCWNHWFYYFLFCFQCGCFSYFFFPLP